MSQKFKVKICSGTTCYVLGGAQLMLLEDMLPADIKDQVEVVGSPCLGVCKQKDMGKPPFAMVNDKILAEASIHSIVEYIRNLQE
jgi:NADH:ubiquinone oxidoreductase subunit E